MSRHAVLGNGNLGNALATMLLKAEQEVKIFSASNGWRYPNNMEDIYDFVPDHIWVTVGAGSVEQAKTNYAPFVDLHLRLPMELAQKINPTYALHLFSTDYVLTNRVASLYALSKQHMEESIFMTNRPKTYIYRIGSLYGTHKPHKCFPYKVKKAWGNLPTTESKLQLPLNPISPTPADWLATILVENCNNLDENRPCLFDISPRLSCTVKEWGELILKQEVESKGMDTERPTERYSPAISFDKYPVNINETWLDLWKEREATWLDFLNKIET